MEKGDIMPVPTQEQIEEALDSLAKILVEDYLLKKSRGNYRPKTEEMRPILPGFD
jgi:hypothetical protein